MTDLESRRLFLQSAAVGLGMSGLAATIGCEKPSTVAPAEQDGKQRRFKAAFSNAGLQATWCAHGMDTAKQWGDWLGVDVRIYDSQFSIDKQRKDIEDIAAQDWDFVCIQAYGIKTLEEPVRRLIDKGVPVIDMDTRIVPEGEEIGLWTFVTPDHEKQGAEATRAVVEAMGFKGKIVHTQGALAHSGAQLRSKGFHSVVSQYPEIQVIDEQPGDWDSNKVAQIWDVLVAKYPDIDGAFIHNDDMAMAAVKACRRANYAHPIVFASIDAQDVGINGVLSGDLVASVMNPAGRIHWTSLMVGYFACAMGQKKADVPNVLMVDHPVITKANAAGYQYLMKQQLL